VCHVGRDFSTLSLLFRPQFSGHPFLFPGGNNPSKGLGRPLFLVAAPPVTSLSRVGNAAALGARGRCPMFTHAWAKAISARFFDILNRSRHDTDGPTDEWSIFGVPIYPRDKIVGRTFSSVFFSLHPCSSADIPREGDSKPELSCAFAR
jgi:hypothetical protein